MDFGKYAKFDSSFVKTKIKKNTELLNAKMTAFFTVIIFCDFIFCHYYCHFILFECESFSDKNTGTTVTESQNFYEHFLKGIDNKKEKWYELTEKKFEKSC